MKKLAAILAFCPCALMAAATYVPAEYIQLRPSSGTAAKVDLGFQVTDTMEFRFKFMLEGHANYGGAIKDYMDETSITTRMIYNNTSQKDFLVSFRSKASGGGATFKNVVTGPGEIIAGYLRKGEAALNSVTNTLPSVAPTTVNDNNLSFNSGAAYNSRIYSFEVWDTVGGVLTKIHDFKPRVNPDDPTDCCFMDGTTKYTASSGTLAAGPTMIIELPTGLKMDVARPKTIEIVPVVKDVETGEVLEAGTDYTYTVTGNDKVGTGTVTVTRLTGEYAGLVASAQYTIASAYAKVYYVTADKTKDPDGTNDCLTKETAGTCANAFAKLSALGTSTSGELILEDGVYDMGAVTNHTVDSSPYVFRLSSENENSTFAVRSASGHPEKCLLVGTADRNFVHRFLYVERNSITFTCDGLMLTNFYGQSSIANYRANYNSLLDFTNCVFRANGLQADISGGCFKGQSVSQIVCRNCAFENNVACFGGVLNSGGANCKFYDCTFTGNEARRDSANWNQSGGGGAIHSSSAWFTNCTFKANRCYGGHEGGGCGGAVYAKNSTPTFVDCAFDGNIGKYPVVRGYNGDSTKAKFYNCTIRNHANEVPCYQAMFVNCLMTNNLAIGQRLLCTNCLFACNVCTSSCAPLVSTSSTIINCTFVSNFTHYVTSAGKYSDQWHNSMIGTGPNYVANSIFIDNDCMYVFGYDGTTPANNNVITNSIYMGGINSGNIVLGSTQISTSPISKTFSGVDYLKLAKTGAHPYAPTRKSKLLVDKGIDVGLTADVADLAGNPRVFGAAIDIGCYENNERAPGLILLIR